MSHVLTAKPVVEEILSKIKKQIGELKTAGVLPGLAIIRVGSRPDDVAYENSIIKSCQVNGIASQTYTLEENIEMQKFMEILQQINENKKIHGIMIFRPLPKQLDENIINHLIVPEKDIDCMNPLNLAKVFAGEDNVLLPCTPAAVIETIKHYEIDMQGANVVVLGRSLVVGKPLGMLFLKENATVTICHSKSKGVQEITKGADILVAAVGKACLIEKSYVSEKSIIIDVGINDAGDGRICGDVDYEAVNEVVEAITPVPGGIGSITTAILLKNVVLACSEQIKTNR